MYGTEGAPSAEEAPTLIFRNCYWQDFSEWAQCQVLEAVSGYRPSNEQEVYDIMNVLDDRLLHSNSAVVMATVKLFLHLTLSMPPTHQQVASSACLCFWLMRGWLQHHAEMGQHYERPAECSLTKFKLCNRSFSCDVIR